MNRKQRKARKIFLRKYGRATNPFWKAQLVVHPFDPPTIERLMTAVWNECQRDGTYSKQTF